MARKISGIWIPIGLDTQQIQGDMERLRKELGVAAASMSQAFDRSLNPANLIKSFGELTKGIGNVRDAARALEHLRPMGNLEGALRYLTPELKELAQTLGLTEEAQKQLLQQMARNNVIQQQVNGLRQLERALGTTREETLRLAQTYGMAVSQMARERYLGSQMRELAPITSQTAEQFRRLARAAGELPSQANFKKFFDLKQIQNAVNAFRQLHPNLKLTSEYYQQIAQAAGVATSQVRAYMQAQGSGGRGILGAFTPSNMTAGIQSALGAAGVVGGMYGVVELGKAMVDASLKMENMTLAFQSIYGSAEKAESQLDFVRQVSQNLGLSFTNTAEGAKKLFASMQGTVLEKDANKIFLAFSNMGAALKLTGDEMNSVFLAISQMASKGKVSAEELRQQLAERMPGAVTLFAQAIGVSTKELDKMLQDGSVGLEHLAKFADAVQEKYKGGAQAASSGLQAELNRVSNAWFDLKRAFVDTDSLASGVNVLATALGKVAEYGPGVASVVGELLKFGLASRVAYSAISGIGALSAKIAELGGAGAAAGIGMTKFMAVLAKLANPVGLAAAALGGVALAVWNNETSMSDGEKVVAKYANTMTTLDEAAKNASLSLEDMNEKQKQNLFDKIAINAEKAARDISALFNAPDVFTLPTDLVSDEMSEMLELVATRSKSGIDSLFDSMRTSFTGAAQSGLLGQVKVLADTVGNQLLGGIREKVGSGKISEILDEARTSFDSFRNELERAGATEQALSQFDRLVSSVIESGNAYRDAEAKLESWGKKTEEVADIAQEASTAYDAIMKLTKGTEVGKENKATKELDSIISGLFTLQQSATEARAEMDFLGEGVDKNSEQWKNLQTRVTQFESIMPAVASLALKGGTDFQAFAEKLHQAAQNADNTTDALENLRVQMQKAYNLALADSVEKSIAAMQSEIVLMGKDASMQSAFSKISGFVKDTAKQTEAAKAFAARNTQDLVKILVDGGMEAQQASQLTATAFEYAQAKGAKSAARTQASAAKAAAQEMSKYAKAIGEVEKKIAELQSKYDDDPSIKYWADVRGEIAKLQNLLEKGTGTEAERARLKGLMQDYERLARVRADQMAEEEKRQKQIALPGQLGSSWGNLSGIDASMNASMQKQALDAQVSAKQIEWQKAMKDGLVTFAETIQGMEDLANERNVKMAALDGDLTANFQIALEQQYQEVQNWQTSVSDIFISGITSASNAFADFFIKGIQDTKSLGEAFSNMVDSMISSLAQLFMQMIVFSSIKKIFGKFDFGGGGDDPLGFGINAKGNVFSGGNISDFSGSVVSRPTFFSGTHLTAYANGGNIMGEKGPEAVLPLRRNNGGRLGVEASVAAPSVEMTQAININIDNRTDSQVTASKTTDAGGNVDIMLLIEQKIGDAMKRPGSAPFRALQNTWQGSTALASR